MTSELSISSDRNEKLYPNHLTNDEAKADVFSCPDQPCLFLRLVKQGAEQASKISKVFDLFGSFATPDVETLTTIMGILDKVIGALTDKVTLEAWNGVKLEAEKGMPRDIFLALYGLHAIALPADFIKFVQDLKSAISVLVDRDRDMGKKEKAKKLFLSGFHLGSDVGAIMYRSGRLLQFLNLLKTLEGFNTAAGWLLTVGALLAIPQSALEGMEIYRAIRFRKEIAKLFPSDPKDQEKMTEYINYLKSCDENTLGTILIAKFDLKTAYDKFYDELAEKITKDKHGEALDQEQIQNERYEQMKAEHKRLKGRVSKVLTKRAANVAGLVCDIAGGTLGGAAIIFSAVPYLAPVSLGCHILGNFIGLGNLAFTHLVLGEGHDLAPSEDWVAVEKYFKSDRNTTRKKIKALKQTNCKDEIAVELKDMLKRLNKMEVGRLAVLFKRNAQTVKNDIETICKLYDSEDTEDQELAKKEAIRYVEKVTFWNRFKPKLKIGIQVAAVVTSLGALVLGLAVPPAMPVSLSIIAVVSSVLIAQPISFYFYEKAHITSRKTREKANTYVPEWHNKLSDKIGALYKKYLKDPITTSIQNKRESSRDNRNKVSDFSFSNTDSELKAMV